MTKSSARLIIANVWAAAGMIAHTPPGIMLCLGAACIWLGLSIMAKGDES